MKYTAYLDGEVLAHGPERTVRYQVAGWLTRIMGEYPVPELADDLMAARQWFNNPKEDYEADVHTPKGVVRLEIKMEGA